jgi:ATP-binding cassette subfamily B protein
VSSAPTQRLAAWQERRASGLVFYFGPDSYAGRRIDELARRAEAAYRRGWQWFFDGGERPTIAVYLVDWFPEAARPSWVGVDRQAIWLPVSPEQPAIGLEQTILRLLASAAGDVESVLVDAVLAGLGALIAAEQGIGLGADDADRTAYEHHVRGAQPARLFLERRIGTAGAIDPSELSFLLFLQRTYGGAALARFARGLLGGTVAPVAQRAYGRPLAELEKEWLATLQARFRGRASGQDLLRCALTVLRSHRLRVLELLGYMAVGLLFSLTIPLSTRYLFDDVIERRELGLVGIWLVTILAAFVVGSVSDYRQAVVAGLIGELVLRDLRGAAFAHLQRLSLRFYTRSSTGDVLSRLTNDLDSIQQTLAEALPQLVYQSLILAAAAAVLLLLNWMLGLLVIVLGVPLYAAVQLRASAHLREASRELGDRIGSMMAFLQEHLSAQVVVKSFGLENRAVSAFGKHLAQLFDSSMQIVRLSAMLTVSAGLIFLGVRVIVLAVGAMLVMDGSMTVGELVAFVSLISQVLTPATAISGMYGQLQATSGAFDRIQELMDEIPDVVDDPRGLDLPQPRREIRLEKVTFRYADGEAALWDVSLAIPVGSRVAIVGPSGAGKSTLAGLLLRLYDPSDGRVLFDGRDIREGNLSSVRRQVAVVPQETFLFDASIRENIALGGEDADEADVVKAAQAAALHSFVERTEAGYDTLVGERGVRLSGGQRQRLAIARALIRDPRILLLDEATSALDPETEAAIMRTLDQVGRGRTTIMITHRLTSARHCDAIFVLDHGHLVESGTHDELYARRGLYWRLYSEQQAGAVEALPPPVEPGRLAGVPLLASLTPTELASVARWATVERYPAGAAIVRQGDLADRLFVIADGEVEVLIGDSRGQSHRVGVLRPRGYFGEIALLGDESARRTATVRAAGPVELYSLHREDFHALLRAQPRLAQDVLRLARIRLDQCRQVVGAVDDRARRTSPSR